MKRLVFLTVWAVLVTSGVLLNQSIGEENTQLTCPGECEQSRESCEQGCSQLVGGGAKSAERRQCKRDCGNELEGCKERCLNPTPRPTIRPEAYHDRACTRACELKRVDCNEVCTKFTGGGAKSGKKAACRNECSESEDYCNKRCADPSLPKNPERMEKPELSCSEDCDYKLQHCEAGCSVYMGGGAKSSKKARCLSECNVTHESCSDSCSE